jgi:hypothetical protein
MRPMLGTTFVDRATRRPVRGVIRQADERDLLGWTRWRYRPDDEDRGWDWWEIFRDCRQSGGRYECYAAVVGPDVQALMMLDVAGRPPGGRRSLVIEYLATSPLNRHLDRGLKHVGIALVGMAVRRSLERKLKGRLWLESLPGAAAFYESLGFRRLPAVSAAGYVVYVLTAARAKALLKTISNRGILAP